ncbi:hypothetical protein Tco_0152480 [Tanacetum coccineum]
MTTLVEHIIVAGAENSPPILEKSMYDSWASCIQLFIKGKKNGRMSLIQSTMVHWSTQLLKKMGRLDLRNTLKLHFVEAQQLQDDCVLKAINIILHGLPPNVYALVNHQEAELMDIG